MANNYYWSRSSTARGVTQWESNVSQIKAVGSNEKGDLDLTDKSKLLHLSSNEWYLM